VSTFWVKIKTACGVLYSSNKNARNHKRQSKNFILIATTGGGCNYYSHFGEKLEV
jgi:hypothetical protein